MAKHQRLATKSQHLKLTIELVPSSSWKNNLRGLLKPSMWKEISDMVVKKHGGKCIICGRIGKLHAHEVWEYDNKNHIQKLEDIIPLCYNCHMVKHIGFASLQQSKFGKDNERFIKHFMKVNNVGRSGYQEHLKEEIEKFNNRSHFEWQLNLENLAKFQ